MNLGEIDVKKIKRLGVKIMYILGEMYVKFMRFLGPLPGEFCMCLRAFCDFLAIWEATFWWILCEFQVILYEIHAILEWNLYEI